VVAHGVDERLFSLPLGPRSAGHVTFLGNLGVPHNVDAVLHLANDLWPGIRRQRPEATLEIAGADPAAAVRRLDGRDGIAVTGAQEDLVALWSRASLLLAPLRFSTGIQNKVLEAMAAGVPVVTTHEAAEGIGASQGKHLLVGSDPASLVAATVSLLRDPAGALAMTERARCFVRESFSWETQVRRLEEIARTAGAERP
jgi:glycosyltransferase involved in cell wall biosynthesis